MPDLPELPGLPNLAIETWIAIGVIIAGFVLCFRGFAVMRWLLAVLGLFAGWQLGGYLASLIDLGPELQDYALAVHWGAIILASLLMGGLSYAFFVTGVLVGIGWVGYTAGSFVAANLGLLGLQATILAATVGVLLVVVAFITRLPRVLLVVLTAVAGAGGIVAGILTLLGEVSLTGLTFENASSVLFSPGLGWYLLYFACAAAGIFLQLRGRTAKNLSAVYT